jgi:extracellular matrix regulatory protein A
MDFQLINIGFGNIVLADDVIAIVNPESAPIKRLIQDVSARGQCCDATEGRQIRAVIITGSGSDPIGRKTRTPRGSLKANSKQDNATKANAKPDHGADNSRSRPDLTNRPAVTTHTAIFSDIKLILSAIQPETVAHRFVLHKDSYLPCPISSEPLDSMDIKLINIGFGNIVSANRVIAIVSPESAPIKRIITDARDRGQLVDATYGRRTRAVIITDYGHIILSAIQPETVAHRFVSSKEGQGSDD